MVELPNVKPLEWVGNTRRVVQEFPKDVRGIVGQALYAAQIGMKHHNAKPLKGFVGSSVVEIVADFDRDTYRAVDTVKLKDVVYALHAFQKKSKTGITTPKKEIDLIKQRLKKAARHYKEHYGTGKSERTN